MGSPNLRQRERIECDVSLTCRMPATPVKATLVDLSHRGCRMRISGARPEAGSTVALELPNGDRVLGEIVWSHAGQAGVRFNRPLSSRTAAALGLEVPKSSVPAAPVIHRESSLGVLQHWIRRLATRFR